MIKKIWYKIAPYIGEAVYLVICHLEDNWRVYAAFFVGYFLG